ncbi:hypothetical protein AB0J52_28850, partial [Spirillospora sp. NPDC049652]
LAAMVAVLLGEYEPPRAARGLGPVVSGLLREDPRERLTAEAVERLLRDALPDPSGASGVPSPAEPGDPGTRAARRAARSPGKGDPAKEDGRDDPDGAPGTTDLGDPDEPVDDLDPVAIPASKRPRFGALVGLGAALAGVALLGAWSARWNSVSKSASSMVQPLPGGSDQTTVYRAAGAFSVEVPADWRSHHITNGVAWADPSDGEGLTIVRAPGDALSGLRADERRAAGAGTYPGYHRLRLESAPDLAPGAAEWEFTWDRGGGSHALRSRVAGYEFFFFTHAKRWTPGARLYDRILRSFDPEPSTGG